MVQKFKIYLFRHGQTTYNKEGRFTGWRDPHITTKGKKDAKEIAKMLKSKKIGISIHTRLTRSKETLKEILTYHPECKKILEDDRMIERNYGDLNGFSHTSYIKNMGKKLYKLEVQGDLIHDLPKEGKKEVEKFLGEQEYNLIHRGYNVPPPNGESFAMVEKRVKSFIKDLKKLVKKEKCNVAISAHGNSIRVFRKIMEKASVKEACSWIIPYNNYFEYRL